MEKRFIGGICLLLSAIMGFVTAGIVYAVEGFFDWIPIAGDIIEAILLVCAIIIVIIAIFPLLGAISVLTKKSWGMGIVGGVIGLATVGPWGLGFIFALIGLIIVAISKDEFEDKAVLGATQPAYGAPPPAYGAPPPMPEQPPAAMQEPVSTEVPPEVPPAMPEPVTPQAPPETPAEEPPQVGGEKPEM